MIEATCDDILYGRLKLWQPVRGPRVSMDTVLLASWVRWRARRPRFVELGAAAGAVSLMLALRFPPPFHVTGVELQAELVELAERNRVSNHLEGRVDFVRGDLRDAALLPPESFDGLVVNPPYESPERGHLSPVASRLIARQGTCAAVDDVAKAASRLLKGDGRFFAVFRTERLAALIRALLAFHLTPKRLKLVYPRPGRPSNIFLIECGKNGGEGLTVEPPLFVLDDAGNQTPELLQAYQIETPIKIKNKSKGENSCL